MISILREVTGTVGDFTYQPHLYYVNGADKLVWFQVGDYSRGLDKYAVPKKFYRTGRKFEKIGEIEEETPANVVEVAGSNGNRYQVDLDEKNCSCPGYKFRGSCKHVEQAINSRQCVAG